jgi:hypothetical protein
MSRLSSSPGVESESLLEFLSEAQGCVIERDDLSNTGVVPPDDLSVFASESDRGTETCQALGTKSHEACAVELVPENPLLAFKSERSEVFFDLDGRSPVRAPMAPTSERSSGFVIQPVPGSYRPSMSPLASTTPRVAPRHRRRARWRYVRWALSFIGACCVNVWSRGHSLIHRLVLRSIHFSEAIGRQTARLMTRARKTTAQCASAAWREVCRVLSLGARQGGALYLDVTRLLRARARVVIARVLQLSRGVMITSDQCALTAWHSIARTFTVQRRRVWGPAASLLARRLRKGGQSTSATLSSVWQRTALAAGQCAFAARRACSITGASANARCRASYVAAWQLASHLQKRRESLWTTTWRTSREGTLTAARCASRAWHVLSRACASIQRSSSEGLYGRSFVNVLRDSGESIVVAARMRWSEARRVPRALRTSRPLHEQDIPVSLPLFVIGAIAVGIIVFLLTTRPPSVAMLALQNSIVTSAQAPNELSSPAEVHPAPIPPPAAPPADTPSTAPVKPTAATMSSAEALPTALIHAAPLPVSTPSVAPSVRHTIATARRGEPGQAEAAVRDRLLVAPPSARVSPLLGSLAVSSWPEGAEVFVNGVWVGATPILLLDLPVGSRAVRVEREGHERWSSAVRVVANERTVVMAELQPSPVR